MYFYSNIFVELAAQARGGDVEAQVRFRLELINALVVMVRQTLRDGRNTSSIAGRILAAARRVTSEHGSSLVNGTDDFVQEVAQTVCAEVVARLQRRPDGLTGDESIRNVGYGETVLASC